MKKIRKVSAKVRRSRKVGLPPGSLLPMGEVKTVRTSITLLDYDVDAISEKTLTTDEAFKLMPPAQGRRWVNVYGLHDAALMAQLGKNFGLHPLVLEDILNTDQRPKIDSFDQYLYLVTRFFHYDADQLAISSEQISIVLGHNFVLTFQERQSGSFDPLRERLRVAGSHLRSANVDYLAYSLLDSVVDRYFIVLEQLGDDCEALEDTLLAKPTAALLHNIHRLKRESVELRRNVWPLREVLNHLTRNENNFFEPGTVLYLRDVYDHTVHFIESLEAIRDLLAGMLDIYLSTISNRVNMEVRALTVVAMLFMPATLIAGIFGMNFKTMPLLEHPDGFWFALGMMGGIASFMGLIFWRRQWLSRRSAD
ncbi:MAG: magnesium/cobalt transporter CorA [Methylophilaceae bacterium]|nr:magnesium/cobalt transporter CorA [Methylophilaceae bacterium]